MDANGFKLDDPARLGYRIETTPDGEIEWVPLTPDDLFDLTPRCETCQDGPHGETLCSLALRFKQCFKGQDALVGIQMRMIWHIPGLREPTPDLFIVKGIWEVPGDWWYFDIVETGLRPSLIIEIATLLDPEARRQDYEAKVEIYEAAKIPEYLIVAPASHLTDGRAVLTGYRLGEEGRYQPIQPDHQGRLLFRSVDLAFGVAEDGREVQVFKLLAERLLTYGEEKERRLALEAENARLRAEIERLRNAQNPV
jgi:putative restriction endonuclease